MFGKLMVCSVFFASAALAAPVCVAGGTLASYVALGSQGCDFGVSDHRKPYFSERGSAGALAAARSLRRR